MTTSNKERIQYITSISLLIGSFTLVVIGFFTPPVGEISSSTLYFFAECLFFAGAVFGLDLMVDRRINKKIHEITNHEPINDYDYETDK